MCVCVCIFTLHMLLLSAVPRRTTDANTATAALLQFIVVSVISMVIVVAAYAACYTHCYSLCQ